MIALANRVAADYLFLRKSLLFRQVMAPFTGAYAISTTHG
jgi:hypothetical protein